MYNTSLQKEAVLGAAHALYSSYFWDEVEQGHTTYPMYGAGAQLESITPELPEETLEPVIWRQLGAIEAAWGTDLWLVFHHMGLEDPEDQEHALFDLLMGCHGHGLCITDDYRDPFERAAALLELGGGVTNRPESPLYLDSNYDLSELAYTYFKTHGYLVEEEAA